MHWLNTFILVAILLVSGDRAENSDWIDPDDMLNYDPASKTMMKQEKQSEQPHTEPPQSGPPQEKETNGDAAPPTEGIPGSNVCSECNCEQTVCPKCPPEKECVCEQAAFRLLQNYIKTLLINIENQTPDGTADYIMHINLSSDQILILNRFITKGKPSHVHDVHEILTIMVKTAMTSDPSSMEKFALLLEHKIGLSLPRLIQFCMLASLASVVLLIEVSLQIPWRRRVSQLIVLMFVISVPWTWYELYKQAEITQHSQTINKIPVECQENASNYWKTLLSFVSLQKDKCTEYYENIMIDPIVKVPPTKAIAVTFVRFFIAPLKDIGTAFSEFLRALLVDLPITYYPVAVIMVTVFFFMFLFMMFGYSIRLPFFLTIEKNPAIAVADGQVHQAIGEGNRQILEQLQGITEKIMANESQFREQIGDLKKVQEMAIEYNMSSTSVTESPSIPKPSITRDIAAVSSDEFHHDDSIKSNTQNNKADKEDKVKYVVVKDIGPNGDSIANGTDETDDDDDDDARKGPNIDTLLPESLLQSDVGLIK